MPRISLIVMMMPPLLFICLQCVGSAPAPLLGLLSLLSGSTTNSTGLLQTLALSHLQHKLDALNVLSDFLAIASNVTSGLSSLG